MPVKKETAVIILETRTATIGSLFMYHNVKWEEARVISGEPHLTKRKVKEALVIKRTST